MPVNASLTAARLAGILWAAVHDAGGPQLAEARHYPRKVDYAWLVSLPLPIGNGRPRDQPVALAHSMAAEFERHNAEHEVAEACRWWPRTQILEDIGFGHEDQWWAMTAVHLTRLSDSALDVTCAIFSSQHGDETLGRHFDTWFGVAVQISGVKRWLTGTDNRIVVMNPGDILLIPKYLVHEVSTPHAPGHSIHMVFEINRD
jgi:hypothetical protein